MSEEATYVEEETVDDSIRTALLTHLDEHGPMKPWDLVDAVDPPDDKAKGGLKELVLAGTIRICANANVRAIDKAEGRME